MIMTWKRIKFNHQTIQILKLKKMKEVADTLNNWKKEILNSFGLSKSRRISKSCPIDGKNT